MTRFLALVALLLVSSTSAFTPDAAFKMNSLLASTQPAAKDINAQKQFAAQYLQQKRNGNVQLSLIGQENIRKSITVPPAYEDYMAVRERSLRRLLNLD